MSYIVFKTDNSVFATGKVGLENMCQSIRKQALKEIEKGETQKFFKELPIEQLKKEKI